MPKQYSVVKKEDNSVVYGPVFEDKYEEIIEFMSGVPSKEKSKLKIEIVENSAQKQEASPTKEPVSETPPSTKKQPAKKEPAKPKSDNSSQTINANDAFSSFLEGSTSTSFWKPKMGKNLIRILPIGGVLPTDWVTPYPLLLCGCHSRVGLSMQDTVHCPRITYGKACPICQFSWNMYNSNDPADKKLSSNIRGYKRIMANIIDLSEVGKGVQVYAFGQKVADKILTFLRSEVEEERTVLDPKVGRNFIVELRSLDGFNNYDNSRFEMKSTSLDDIYPTWEKEVHDLKKYIEPKSYDELVKIVKQTQQAILNSSPTSWRDEGGAVGAANDDVDTVEVTEDEIDNRLKNL